MTERKPARPRDALGRPLAHDALGVEPVSEVALPPEEALALAQELIDGGRAFSAHEVLEAVWKSCPAAERPLWQGLAQLCVGAVHHERGNDTGAAALLARGAGRLREYDGPRYGVDLEGLLAWAEAAQWDRLRLGTR
ncbi:MAG: uncharacterized protein QOJ92_2704 [Frankiales bacterium]|nr:uncharacterized protein [Frankiales bacterium]